MLITQFAPRAMFRRSLIAVAAVTLLAALALDAPPALAETSHLRLTQASFGNTQNLSIGINKSVIVDLPVDVKEVIVSQPSIAPTIMRTKRRAIVQGSAAGSTNIFFLDGNGRTISVIDVTVGQEPSPLANTLSASLARVLPGSNIQVEVLSNDSPDGKTHFMLTGTVRSAQDKAVAEQIATELSESDTPVGSLIQVLDSQQVMLKVTVAEVARETVKQLGISLNASANLGSAVIGLNSQQALGGASGVTTANGVGVNLNTGTFQLDAMLRTLERRGSLRTLAEPTLTAMSGQEAEFTAGGEFPVPTDVADNVVTYAFKEFGVGLKFTPTVKSDGLIALTVDTSVSALTTEGGFNAGVVTIPATRKRQAKTSVELQAGCTLAIAGLFQDEVRQQINKFPGLGDIPILGTLFRSRDFIRSQTELVILVTPYIAQTGRPELPTDNYVIASDAEAIFLGRMENNYAVGGSGKDKSGLRRGYNGSVGFILD